MAQRKVKIEAPTASQHKQAEPMRLGIEEARALMLAGLLKSRPAVFGPSTLHTRDNRFS